MCIPRRAADRTPIPGSGGATLTTGERGPDGAEGPEALERLVRRGLKWSFGGGVGIKLATFAPTIVMARILTPRDFGIYTVGAVTLMATASINDLGIEATLVRWPGPLEEVLPTAMTAVIGLSLVLFGALWMLAPLIADALSAPEGAGVIRVMSIGIVISGAFTVNSALTTRRFRQRVRTIGEALASATTVGVGIGLALKGFGPYSLAVGHVLGNLAVGVVLFVGSPVRVWPRWSWTLAKRLIAQGLPVAGAGLFTVAVLNVDYVTVGHVLGATSLGLYMLAWNIANWPVTIFSEAIHKVSLPAFARAQGDPAELGTALASWMRWALLLTVPMCALLAGLSPSVVRFVYGHRWSAAAGPLGFLAVMVVVKVTVLLASDALVAGGWGRKVFALQAAWLPALAGAIVVGTRLDGITGAGIAQLVVACAVPLPMLAAILARRHLRPGIIVGRARRPLLAAAPVVAVCVLAAEVPAPPFARLAVTGTIGVAVYAAAVWPLLQPLLAARRPRSRRDALGRVGSAAVLPTPGLPAAAEPVVGPAAS